MVVPADAMAVAPARTFVKNCTEGVVCQPCAIVTTRTEDTLRGAVDAERPQRKFKNPPTHPSTRFALRWSMPRSPTGSRKLHSVEAGLPATAVASPRVAASRLGVLEAPASCCSVVHGGSTPATSKLQRRAGAAPASRGPLSGLQP